jgi:hypothetical protein
MAWAISSLPHHNPPLPSPSQFIPSPQLFSLKLTENICSPFFGSRFLFHLRDQREANEREEVAKRQLDGNHNGDETNSLPEMGKTDGMELQEENKVERNGSPSVSIHSQLSDIKPPSDDSLTDDTNTPSEDSGRNPTRKLKLKRGRPKKLSSPLPNTFENSPSSSTPINSLTSVPRDKVSDGDGIFSSLSLDSIQIPIAPQSSSLSDTIGFPLRSASFIDWNIADEVKASRESGTCNFLPLPSSVWQEPSEPSVVSQLTYQDLQPHSPLSTSHPEVMLSDLPSLPLLSINNSRSWSPLRHTSPSPRTAPPLALPPPDLLEDFTEGATMPADAVGLSPASEDRTMNSFIDRFLRLQPTASRNAESRERPDSGRKFITCLPSSQPIPRTTPFPPYLPPPVPASIHLQPYRGPAEIASDLRHQSQYPSVSAIIPSASLPSSQAPAMPTVTDFSDLSDLFSHDEICDLLTSLVQDETEEEQHPPLPQDQPVFLPQQATPISRQSVASYRPAVANYTHREIRKRKLETDEDQGGLIDQSGSSSRSPRSQSSSSGGYLHFDDRAAYAAALARGEAIPSSAPSSVGCLSQQHGSSNGGNYEGQSQYPSSHHPHGEAKLQGLVGLRHVLSSVRRRTPSFSLPQQSQVTPLQLTSAEYRRGGPLETPAAAAASLSRLSQSRREYPSLQHRSGSRGESE